MNNLLIRLLIPAATAVGALLLNASAVAVELIRWEKLPIPVALVVDQERVVFLERNVRVGISSAVADRLRVQSASGTLYLRASADIEPTRLQVQDVESGEIILLDIATVPATPKPLEPIKIVHEQLHSEHADSGAPVKKHSLSIPAPVALTRYAAQMMYAPLRTVEPIPGIQQIPIKAQGNLPVFPTLDIKAEAIAAFRLGDYIVTAVKLQNTNVSRVELDPRKVQAKLHSITLQHDWLGPISSAEDTTVAYMVTHNGGLETALPGALLQKLEK